MREKKKQDWSPRIQEVWVLMTTVDGDSEVEVYLTEELALGAVAKLMMEGIEDLDPEDQARILTLLGENRFDEAAVQWARYTNVSYSWNDHPILRE